MQSKGLVISIYYTETRHAFLMTPQVSFVCKVLKSVLGHAYFCCWKKCHFGNECVPQVEQRSIFYLGKVVVWGTGFYGFCSSKCQTSYQNVKCDFMTSCQYLSQNNVSQIHNVALQVQTVQNNSQTTISKEPCACSGNLLLYEQKMYMLQNIADWSVS